MRKTHGDKPAVFLSFYLDYIRDVSASFDFKY